MEISCGCEWSGRPYVLTCPSGAQRGPLRDNQSVLIMRQILRGAAVGFFGKSGNRGREWWFCVGPKCFEENYRYIYRLYRDTSRSRHVNIMRLVLFFFCISYGSVSAFAGPLSREDWWPQSYLVLFNLFIDNLSSIPTIAQKPQTPLVCWLRKFSRYGVFCSEYVWYLQAILIEI